jgi:hypothetical protein
MPAECKNAKKPTRDSGGLRNDRAIDLDVIDPRLKVVAT